MAAPTLETERLILRGHRLDDFQDSLALWSDPDVVSHIGGRPFALDEVWTRLLRYAGHWALLGYGYWVVRERDGGFVGEVGLADYKRGLGAEFDDAPEAGWALAPCAQGRGLAREAISAVLAWRDRTLTGGRTVCMIAPENTASVRTAERCGFVPFREAQYRGSTTTLFQRSTRR